MSKRDSLNHYERNKKYKEKDRERKEKPRTRKTKAEKIKISTKNFEKFVDDLEDLGG